MRVFSGNAFQVLIAMAVGAYSLSANARADEIVLVAGGGNDANQDAPATQAKLTAPFGIDRDAKGDWIFVELTGHRVAKMNSQGLVSTIAGTGEKGDGGDGGPGLKALFNGPHSLAIGPDGATAYIADTWNNRVRKVDLKTGRVEAAFGTGEKGDSSDEAPTPAAQAQFGGIYCVAINPQGTKIYLTDLDNRRIRAVDLASGLVVTVAGNGRKGVPKDGETAREAPLVDPRAAIADSDGNVYVLERGGHALRVVDSSGEIRTVVNASGEKGDSDGDNALSARLNGPKHLCMDRDGGVIIADTENHRIRKYSPKDGKVIVLAGTGRKGAAGLGGDPKKAELHQPHGVFVAKDGTLYITDSSNDRILKIVRD